MVFGFLVFIQAKQRASVQWLLSKSYSHQVPEDVREPFYRDVEVNILDDVDMDMFGVWAHD